MEHRIGSLHGISGRGRVRLTWFFAALLASLPLGGCTLTDVVGPSEIGDEGEPGSSGPTPTLAGVETGLLVVDSVDVLILESFPVQVNVVVRGSLTDGCTEVGEIRQERSGNTIAVTIATTRDSQALCTQALVPTEVTVSLDGDFPMGDYTVTVNGVVAEFRI